MGNVSMIFKNVSIGDSQFAVGVMGPKRMNYQKVIDMINTLATGIDHVLSDNSDYEQLPPSKFK